ncbi:MAG: hypothetical protein KDB21_07520 [Acidimicrobiales bacterium]|nr:hypothetical protein [Acidimicrobiales bacterium]MCB1039834.1 hypothetical protein [Acidimicrobiales bacterium]
MAGVLLIGFGAVTLRWTRRWRDRQEADTHDRYGTYDGTPPRGALPDWYFSVNIGAAWFIMVIGAVVVFVRLASAVASLL